MYTIIDLRSKKDKDRMGKKIVRSANRVKRKKKIVKYAKVILLILLLLLVIIYAVMFIFFGRGSFTIRLDRNLHFERGIIIYDDPEYKVFRAELLAEPVDHLDNIAYKWLPDDLDQYKGGSHNGENYIAYTFYVENLGDYVADYWSEITIDEVFKNVDEAIRIRVYRNGQYKTYGKIGKSGEPERDTIPFVDEELVVREHIVNFKPNDINKYTVVIWIEGTDPECTDNILNGEIKISMSFNSEIIEKEE
jgi:hypothetical protein